MLPANETGVSLTVFPMLTKNTWSFSPRSSFLRSQSVATLQLILLLTCFTAFSLGNVDFASGQTDPAPQTTDDEQEEKKTGPKNVTLKTKDKIQLVCTYFPPVAQPKPDADKDKTDDKETDEDEAINGKRVIPYIILHDWESSRADTAALAKFLSDKGNAVITPDLRGHGESITVAGFDRPLKAANFKTPEIATVLKDIEQCKRFLVKKNNAGELNIDMLAIIAIGKTAPLAAAWSVSDWTAYAPYRDGIKQGQDVKSLIMIAPEKKLGPFSMNRIVSASIFTGDHALPTIVAWGTGSPKAKEIESILKVLKKKRPDRKGDSAAKTLFQAPLRNSSRTGVQIGSDESLDRLWDFFHETVSDKINENIDKLPWQDRRKKNKK